MAAQVTRSLQVNNIRTLSTKVQDLDFKMVPS
jgi:hypothetical protein